MKTTVKQCQKVIKFYDKDLDNKLTFKEFLPMILPLDNSDIRDYAVNKEIHNRLPYTIEDLLLQIVTREIECTEHIEIEKKKLLSLYDYNPQIAFKAINNDKYLTFDSLEKYFKRLNMSADVVAIMRRLDQDFDCKVSFDEFAKVFGSTKHNFSYNTPTKAFQSRIAWNSLDTSKTMHSTPSKVKSGVIEAVHRKEQSSFISSKETYSRNSIGTLSRKAIKASNELIKSLNKEAGIELVYRAMEEQVEAELQIELIKQDLALCDKTTIRGVWLLFDTTEKGYITIKEVIDVLELLKLKTTTAQTLFNRFDVNKDGVWEYKNIKNIITPVEKDYADILYLRGNEDILSKEALMVLKHLFKVYLENKVKYMIDKEVIKQAFNKLSHKHFLTLLDVRVRLNM